MVYTSCESAEKAYNLATGGVDFMYNKFGFIGADGKEVQFGTFMKNFGNDTPFHVGVIEGVSLPAMVYRFCASLSMYKNEYEVF